MGDGYRLGQDDVWHAAWPLRLGPAGSDRVVEAHRIRCTHHDAFCLAREARELDVRASPYDLRSLGYEPVPIETPEGKERFTQEQREFAERAASMRARLLDVCERLLSRGPA